MPTENRSNDADGWIACDDGLHLIQMDKNLSHYGWVFRKVDGSLPYSVREATSHEMAHAQARQHLRIGVAQIAGQAPAPQSHPEPIAWMVGTAFWWTKEEAERDAVETGLPIVGMGPMTGAAPAEQHQGVPVAWVRFRNGGPDYDGDAVMIMNVPGDTLGDGDSWEPVYTHADPGEVERLHEKIRQLQIALSGVQGRWASLETALLAKLAKQDALLDRVADHAKFWHGHPYAEVLEGIAKDYKALSASAEPNAPVVAIPDGYCIMPRRLTAENGAKALLLGEFKLEVNQECPECRELDEPVEGCKICDGEGEYGQRHIIPWDKITYIYSEAVKGLAIQPNTTREPG